jgi:general secretion pathway protein I
VKVARPRCGGFTLIEVLVALAIVTIGMAAVLGTLSSSADTVSYLRDKTFAQWVGLNQIANLRLSGQVAPTGNSEGDTDFAGRKWHWRQDVAATQIPGVVRIDVSIRPAEVKGDNINWMTTVSGIQGDSVGVPNGYLPDWGAQLLPGQNGQIPGANSAAGAIGAGAATFGVQGGSGSSTLGGSSGLGGSSNNSSSLGGSSFGGASGPQNAPTPPTPPQDPDEDSPQ